MPLLRAVLILVLVASASIALSITFGAEVLAALGLILAQLKILWVKLFSLSSKTIFVWLKAQGVNFARVEVGKRWFMKSMLPLIIGASTQRRISEFTRHYFGIAKDRYAQMMDWYAGLPRAMKFTLILIAMFSTLAMAVATMSIWLLLFSIQLPLWILAGMAAFWTMLWTTAQKLLFRTLAFMQLYRLWGFLRRRVPPGYLARVRRFNFRIARIVVRRRRMTVAQVHLQKHSLAMRWELFREYFRHARPEQPSDAEFKAMRKSQQAKDA